MLFPYMFGLRSEEAPMPWKARDARKFTKKAKTPKQKRKWKKVANSMLKHGASDKAAVRAANAVVKRGRKKKR